MVITVLRITWDGVLRRATVDTAGRADAARLEQLAAAARLQVPPYLPEPGQEVYQVHIGEHVVHVAEGELAGSLLELVTAVLAEGEDGD